MGVRRVLQSLVEETNSVLSVPAEVVARKTTSKRGSAGVVCTTTEGDEAAAATPHTAVPMRATTSVAASVIISRKRDLVAFVIVRVLWSVGVCGFVLLFFLFFYFPQVYPPVCLFVLVCLFSFPFLSFPLFGCYLSLIPT